MARHPQTELTDPVVLEWGNEHSLHIEERHNGVWLKLFVVKEKSTQPIEIKAPIGMTTRMIVDAWKAQGSHWVELIKHDDGSIFTATRVIWLENGRLQWSVQHENGYPSDTLGFTPATKVIWEAAKAKQETC